MKASLWIFLILSAAASAGEPSARLGMSGGDTDAGVHRTEAIAYSWALGGTLLGVGLGAAMISMEFAGSAPEGPWFPATGILAMSAGIVAGPSLGQYYAGSPWHGSAGVAIRALGLGLMIANLDSFFWGSRNCQGLLDHAGDESCEDDDRPFDPMRTAGLVTLSAGVAYSLVDTHFAIRRKASRRQAWTGGVSPGLLLSSGVSPRLGALAWLRF